MRKKLSYVGMTGLVILALCVLPLSANALTLILDTTISGDTPSGNLEATFTSIDATHVQLTLSAVNLTNPEEFVTGWYFNVVPTIDLASLSIGPPVVLAGDGASVYADNYGTDAFKADGDGYFDLLLAFETSNAGHGVSRFGAGEELTFLITYNGTGVFNDQSFNDFSASGGGAGTFLSAAHVQGIDGPEGSGWVAAVPEPATILLLGFGLVGLAGIGRKKRSA